MVTRESIWNFTHGWFRCIIVEWWHEPENDKDETMMKDLGFGWRRFNSYVLVEKSKHPELFASVKQKRFSKDLWWRTYYVCDAFDFFWGTTLVEPQYRHSDWTVFAYKVGNDFQHIFNTDSERKYEYVKEKLIDTIDKHLSSNAK